MLFRVQTKVPITKVQFFAFSIQNAKQKIVSFKFGANEVLLDNYLKEKFNIGLRPMCFGLLNKLQPAQITDTELIFTFIDDNSDKLASFITYGDGKLEGSQILTQALTRKVKGT
jgi:hypothetical protein